MSIRIEVKSVEVTPRTVNIKQGPRAGQQATFQEQTAYAYTVDDNGKPRDYPERIRINIDTGAGQQPYAPGFYMPAPQSFYVDRFEGLTLGRTKLVPVKG